MLNISYTPEVKIKILPDSNLIVGSNAFFICSYDSNPSPVSILWLKNGSNLSTHKTFAINNITLADAGHYRCIVSNGYVSGEDNIEISVLELIFQRNEEQNTIHGNAGEIFNLACFMTKAMTGVHLKAIYNHSVVTEVASYLLNVSFIASKELNRKQYICKAEFDGMNISLETMVVFNITYKPAVKIKVFPRLNITAGRNATFICSYDSNPNPVSISWKKDGSVLSTKDMFVITKISRSDAGYYQCIVDNGKFAGEDGAHIFVSYTLQVSIIASPDKLVTEGQKLVLVCTHDSSLQAAITWIRHGMHVSTNQALVIQSVSTNDSGLYQCIVNTTIRYGAEEISISVTELAREDENFRKEMVYYMIAAAVVLVLLFFIIWKAYMHGKSRGLEIDRTARTNDINRQENTNHGTNENSQITDSLTTMMQHEDDRSSSNYETINENEMLPFLDSSRLVIVERDLNVDTNSRRNSEDGDAENQKDTTSSSSDSKSVSTNETERQEHEIIETTSDASLSDNAGHTSNIPNEFRNPYEPLIINEMEYLNSYSALRRINN